MFKLAHTFSSTLLNETSFNYADNVLRINPMGMAGAAPGWTGTTFFPLANNVGIRMPEIDLGASYNTNWITFRGKTFMPPINYATIFPDKWPSAVQIERQLYASAGRKQDTPRELSTVEKIVPNGKTVHWRLTRLYESLVDEAASGVVVKETQHVVEEANNSVFHPLHSTQR